MSRGACSILSTDGVVRRRYDRSLINFFGIYSQFAHSWLMVNNSVRARPRVVANALSVGLSGFSGLTNGAPYAPDMSD
jgi:hypothetical protein